MAAPIIEPVPVVYTYADEAIGPRFGIRSGRMTAKDLQLHRHDYYEVWFFTNGGAKQRISFREHTTRRGSIFFIAPMMPHQPCFSVDDTCFILYFDLAFLRPELGGAHVEIDTELLERAPELAPFVCQESIDFTLSDDEIGHFQILCQRILTEHKRSHACSKQITRSLLSLLLAEVTQKYDKEIWTHIADAPPSGGADRHVKQTLRFITNNFTKKIMLTDAARHAAVSANYLASLLKRETGKSFVEIVTEKRLNRASELLSYTNLQIAEIAYDVGFHDPDYFCRRFKLFTGITPQRFRAGHRVFMPKRSPHCADSPLKRLSSR